MKERFSPGDRVRVADSYRWAQGALGTVTLPPGYVVEITGDWQGARREVEALRGTIIFYWVQFDQPQRGADGEGPYFAGEIESDCLLAAGGE